MNGLRTNLPSSVPSLHRSARSVTGVAPCRAEAKRPTIAARSVRLGPGRRTRQATSGDKLLPIQAAMDSGQVHSEPVR